VYDAMVCERLHAVWGWGRGDVCDTGARAKL
jgi:hypothetical protein